MDRETERRFGELFRFGVISEVRHEDGLCRVSFGERVSPPSPWIMGRCGKDKEYWHPDIGEQAVFFSPGGEGSAGFVVVGVMSDRMPLPADAGEGKHITEYEDGTRILVDRKQHLLEILDSFGSSIRMEGGYIHIKPAIKVKISRGGKG
jgi:phage baseplate assembly protein V